jgi:hypothetical protein
MPVNLLSAGGGTTTLTTESSASNFTLTLPASTGTVIATAPGTSSNVLTSNGTAWTSVAPAVPASLSTASGSAPSYSARAWVNFDGTGTPAIRASGNVTSITDNGTGNYTVNFTNAMPDANYGANVTSFAQSGSGGDGNVTSTATGSVTVFTHQLSGATAIDLSIVCVSIFR